ncbi:hypothetical protein OJJOAM_000064 [Cupriavidus sp. H18C1]
MATASPPVHRPRSAAPGGIALHPGRPVVRPRHRQRLRRGRLPDPAYAASAARYAGPVPRRAAAARRDRRGDGGDPPPRRRARAGGLHHARGVHAWAALLCRRARDRAAQLHRRAAAGRTGPVGQRHRRDWPGAGAVHRLGLPADPGRAGLAAREHRCGRHFRRCAGRGAPQCRRLRPRGPHPPVSRRPVRAASGRRHLRRDPQQSALCERRRHAASAGRISGRAAHCAGRRRRRHGRGAPDRGRRTRPPEPRRRAGGRDRQRVRECRGRLPPIWNWSG